MCTAIEKARKVITKRLTRERWIIVGPDCAICGRSIIGAAEVQEVLVTWEMAQTWGEEEVILIYSTANCVMVHPGECHDRAGRDQSKEKLVAHLLTWQGYTHIEAWMDGLNRPDKLWLIAQKKYVRGLMKRMILVSTLSETKRSGRIAFE